MNKTRYVVKLYIAPPGAEMRYPDGTINNSSVGHVYYGISIVG